MGFRDFIKYKSSKGHSALPCTVCLTLKALLGSKVTFVESRVGDGLGMRLGITIAVFVF